MTPLRLVLFAAVLTLSACGKTYVPVTGSVEAMGEITGTLELVDTNCNTVTDLSDLSIIGGSEDSRLTIDSVNRTWKISNLSYGSYEVFIYKPGFGAYKKAKILVTYDHPRVDLGNVRLGQNPSYTAYITSITTRDTVTDLMEGDKVIMVNGRVSMPASDGGPQRNVTVLFNYGKGGITPDLSVVPYITVGKTKGSSSEFTIEVLKSQLSSAMNIEHATWITAVGGPIPCGTTYTVDYGTRVINTSVNTTQMIDATMFEIP